MQCNTDRVLKSKGSVKQSLGTYPPTTPQIRRYQNVRLRKGYSGSSLESRKRVASDILSPD